MRAGALRRPAALGIVAALLTAPMAAAAEPSPEDWARQAVAALCPLSTLEGLDAQARVPGSWLLEETPARSGATVSRARVRLLLPGAGELTLERRQVGDRLRQFIAAVFDPPPAEGAEPEPRLQVFADGACVIRSGRRIRREGPALTLLDQLDGDLTTVRWTETLQAPWPPGADPGGVRVALVDSGLAYDLPLYRDRLARSETGAPLGYDFWDLDPWPYDGDVARGPFLPIRHGSAVASVLVREAPKAALIPYRYPRPDMARLGDLVDQAAAAGARILAMPLGSRRPEDWTAFADALARNDILAIVSAGNDGHDLDQQPLWPAALPIERMIVVTSSDGFGRLADGANWGSTSVDVMTPAENVLVTDFRGAEGRASGSSYAVPRIAALAARLLEAEPNLSADALKARVLERAAPSPFERSGILAVGWIADPTDSP